MAVRQVQNTVALLVMICTCGVGQSTSVTPAIVSVYGNLADVNSTITWQPLSSNANYKTDVTGVQGGLKTYFDMVSSFVSTIAPGAIPYEMLSDVMSDSGFDIGKYQSTLISWGIGFGICAALGILFIIIFPIVGCCFCCCRCCCQKCGGKMMQKSSPNNNCKRIVFSIVLFLITLLTAVGMVCVFVTNDQTSDGLKELPNVITNNIDDISLYLNDTVEQVIHLSVENFNFTKQVIFRDLDNIGVIVGEPVKDVLNKQGVQNVIDVAYNFSNIVLENIAQTLTSLNTSIEDLQMKTNTLDAALDFIRPLIDTTLQHADCQPTLNCTVLASTTSLLDINFDPAKLPSLSSEMSQVESIRSTNLSNLIQQGKNAFDMIPQNITDQTASIVADLKTQVDSFDSSVESAVSGVTDLLSAGGVLDQVNDFKDSISEYADYAEKYDRYRWMGGVGLTSVIMVIVLCFLFGVMCGTCGYDKNVDPTERSCLATCGGNFMMAATGLIFIFAPLLMLLTLLLFLPGAALERLVCQTMTDPNSEIFSKVIDEPGGLPIGGSDEYLLGKLLLQNGSIPLKFGDILTKCGRNEAAYSALRLQDLSAVDLSLITDYKSTINITGQIDQINTQIDFSQLSIMNNDTKQQLRNFQNAILSIDFNGFVNELKQNATNVTLTDFANQLLLLHPTSLNNVPTELAAEAANLTSIDNNEWANVTAAKDAVLQAILQLNDSVATLPAAIDALLLEADTVDAFLQANGSSTIKNEATNYANRLFGVVDSFINFTMDSLQNDLAGCKPLYNLYMSLTEVLICQTVVDNMNGIWFGLGWCIFLFIPNMIFGVKLAKHFRKMKYKEGYDDASKMRNHAAPSRSPPPSYPGSGHNKVGVAEDSL